MVPRPRAVVHGENSEQGEESHCSCQWHDLRRAAPPTAVLASGMALFPWHLSSAW